MFPGMSETHPDRLERLVRSGRLVRMIQLAFVIPQLLIGAIFTGVSTYSLLEYGWPALAAYLRGEFSGEQSALVLFAFLAIGAFFLLVGASILLSGLRTLVMGNADGGSSPETQRTSQQIDESRARVLGIPILPRRLAQAAPAVNGAHRLLAPLTTPDGFLELRSRPLHLTLGLALAGFAAFWNGVIVLAARDLLGWGPVGWIFGLFLVPFVLVGVGLLGGAAYFLSALVHPELTVRVKMDRERRTLTGTWSFARPPSRLLHMRIDLRVTERLIEGRGDDATTKSVPVLEQTLVEGASLRAADRGEFSYRWPEGLELPHQGEARHVDWVLRFKASSTGLPSLRFWMPLGAWSPAGDRGLSCAP
jgi:hypothetical protein